MDSFLGGDSMADLSLVHADSEVAVDADGPTDAKPDNNQDAVMTADEAEASRNFTEVLERCTSGACLLDTVKNYFETSGKGQGRHIFSHLKKILVARKPDAGIAKKGNIS
jgi:hypothetical protein